MILYAPDLFEFFILGWCHEKLKRNVAGPSFSEFYAG